MVRELPKEGQLDISPKNGYYFYKLWQTKYNCCYNSRSMHVDGGAVVFGGGELSAFSINIVITLCISPSPPFKTTSGDRLGLSSRGRGRRGGSRGVSNQERGHHTKFQSSWSCHVLHPGLYFTQGGTPKIQDTRLSAFRPSISRTYLRPK